MQTAIASKKWVRAASKCAALGVLAITVSGCVIDPYPPGPPAAAVGPAYYPGPYSYYSYPGPYTYGPSGGVVFDFGGRGGGCCWHDHHWR